MEKQKNYLKKSFAVLSACVCSCLATNYNSSIYASGPSVTKAEKIFNQATGGFEKVREYLNKEFSNMTFEQVYKEVLKDNVKKADIQIRECYFVALCDKLFQSGVKYDQETALRLENDIKKKYGVQAISKIPFDTVVSELSSELIKKLAGHCKFFAAFISDTLNKLNIPNAVLLTATKEMENSKIGGHWENLYLINGVIKHIDGSHIDNLKKQVLKYFRKCSGTYLKNKLYCDTTQQRKLILQVDLYKQNREFLLLYKTTDDTISNDEALKSIENADAKILEYLSK